MNKTSNKQQGYVALIAVLIIGAAALAIGLGTLTLGTDSQRETLVQQQSVQARNLATACAEEGLQYLHDNPSTTNYNNSLTLGQGGCTYSIGGSSPKQIDAAGTVGDITRRVKVTATVGSTITINSWQEIAGDIATFAFVQATGSTNDNSSTTIAQAYTSNVTAGNLLIIALSWDTDSGINLSCADTRGNTYSYTPIWNYATNQQAISYCYAVANSSGANTVTATFDAGGASYRRIVVTEYSGNAASPFDSAAGVSGVLATTGTDAVTSGNTTTTQNGDLVFGSVADVDSVTTIAAGTGFTQRYSLNGKDFAIQDKIQSTAGPVASTQTFGATHRYNAAVVTFKANIQ